MLSAIISLVVWEHLPFLGIIILYDCWMYVGFEMDMVVVVTSGCSLTIQV